MFVVLLPAHFSIFLYLLLIKGSGFPFHGPTFHALMAGGMGRTNTLLTAAMGEMGQILMQSFPCLTHKSLENLC